MILKETIIYAKDGKFVISLEASRDYDASPVFDVIWYEVSHEGTRPDRRHISSSPSRIDSDRVFNDTVNKFEMDHP